MTPVLVRQWTIDDVHDLRVLRAELGEEIADADLFDRIAVVATELATNAMRHGTPPATVRLLAEPGRLIVDVSDRDPVGEPQFGLEPRPMGEGGFGLLLVRTFATDSGWHRTEHGKRTWASFSALG
ncbi:ATP-binding protein [Actinoplanes sp. NPDC020271]|uniref:ATP-binding protein n=1 Tax=Actinoplanes sp. NPDC020271 TaxID=3363896 RepID=UPI0037A59CED